MKVLLLNGSPHPDGCIFTSLSEVGGALKRNGIDSEIFWIGNRPVQGCVACWKCRETGNGCVFKDKLYTEFVAGMKECDGLVVGAGVDDGALTTLANARLTLLGNLLNPLSCLGYGIRDGKAADNHPGNDDAHEDNVANDGTHELEKDVCNHASHITSRALRKRRVKDKAGVGDGLGEVEREHGKNGEHDQ